MRVRRSKTAYYIHHTHTVIAVVGEQQRAEMRPRSFQVRPADNDELLTIEAYGLVSVSRRIGRIDRLGASCLGLTLSHVCGIALFRTI